jgi:hypothetical protein
MLGWCHRHYADFGACTSVQLVLTTWVSLLAQVQRSRVWDACVHYSATLMHLFDRLSSV